VARRHDGHAVIAERAGHDDPIARGQAGVADEVRRERHTGGVDDDAVDLALAHDLRVAGDHRRAGFFARDAHRREDPFEIRAREAFFEDHGAREAEDVWRAHHREIVDGAGDGQASDVAAWKEGRLDHVRVGRHDEPAVAEPDGAAVIHRPDAEHPGRHLRIGFERVQERLFDEAAHRAPACAVLEHDAFVGD